MCEISLWIQVTTEGEIQQIRKQQGKCWHKLESYGAVIHALHFIAIFQLADCWKTPWFTVVAAQFAAAAGR